MTTQEITLALKANIGKTVLVTPTEGQDSEPELLFVISVDGEGFSYRILTDPALCDPSVVHWWHYSDVVDVRPPNA